MTADAAAATSAPPIRSRRGAERASWARVLRPVARRVVAGGGAVACDGPSGLVEAEQTEGYAQPEEAQS